jgi:hypothetical protein
MRPAVRAGMLSAAVVAALLVAAAPAAGAPRERVTGKLDAAGYTVIAVARDGEASSDRTKGGKFGFRPPAGHFTLHLRKADGTYGGPVVVAREGERHAIVGLLAGAELGKIDVSARKGYAKVAGGAPRDSIDADIHARARNGVPLGADVFGLVRSKPPRNKVAGDRDLDGVPDPLDVDDDGDLVVDDLDRGRRTRAAERRWGGRRLARAEDADDFVFELTLPLQIEQALNANAGGVTVAQIDQLLATHGDLVLGTPRADSVELDCGRPQSRTDPGLGGLVYCTKGGTGREVRFGVPADAWPRFPDDFDDDRDGLGSVGPPGGLKGPLRHGATSTQIGTGDVLIARVVDGGVERELAATLQYVPVTVAALAGYSDGQGNAQGVAYPVSPSGPGTPGNPFPVRANANGEVILTVTLWRPQRARLATDPPARPELGDSTTWTDIGALIYGTSFGSDCQPRSISENDPNLEIVEDPNPSGGEAGEGFGLTDRARDLPANPNNTLTYTVNLTECLAESPPPTNVWNVGETRSVDFGAGDGFGGAGTLTVYFKRVG